MINSDNIKNIISFIPCVPLAGISATSTYFALKGNYDNSVSLCLLSTFCGISLYASFKIQDWAIQKIGAYQLKEVLRRIQSCPATLELYEKAKQEINRHHGLDELRFESIPNHLHGALSCSFLGLISVSSNFSIAKTQAAVIFELANLAQCEKFLKIKHRTRKGKLNRETYALQNAQVEWETSRIAKKTIEQAKIDNPKDWTGVSCLQEEILSLPEEQRWEWQKINMPEYVNHYKNQYP
jgi:hypothetical protein